MMFAKTESACLMGLEAARVQVEVGLARGLPSLSIVGLPDASIREARDRVVSAIRHSGFEFPSRRITINLAPADLRKEGALFDVAMAAGILMASESLSPAQWPRCIWLGELALDGAIRPVRGALALVRSLAGQGWTSFILPADNLPEVAFMEGVQFMGFRHLRDLAAWLEGRGEPADPPPLPAWVPGNGSPDGDLVHVKGQALAKRALEITAAGGHNLLLLGTPGTGKSMLARALPSLLPAWTFEEAMEATQVHSLVGVVPETGLLRSRPFRSPHHSVSAPALVGGGDLPAPGEISLAHHGVLFLDELPEFRRDALESLRQPMEEGLVHVQRARGRARFPAQFQLIAAMNPCPCGNRGHPLKECVCSESRIRQYLGRISGPLLDRIDLHVELPVLEVDELLAERGGGETSEQVRVRVERAHAAQQARRLAAGGPARRNARYGVLELNQFCRLDEGSRRLLKAVMAKLGFSARAFDRIRRVARTIADLEGDDQPRERHVAEAIQFRLFDRRPAFH